MVTVEQAAEKATAAVAGSAAKEYKRESTTARLVGAGQYIYSYVYASVVANASRQVLLVSRSLLSSTRSIRLRSA